MAKLSQTIDALSDALGLPRATVEVFARPLRDERMISTGGRGVNAPEMNARDIAVLLLAILTGGQANHAARRVRAFSERKPRLVLLNDEGVSGSEVVSIPESIEEHRRALESSPFFKTLKLSYRSTLIEFVDKMIEYYSTSDVDERRTAFIQAAVAHIPDGDEEALHEAAIQADVEFFNQNTGEMLNEIAFSISCREGMLPLAQLTASYVDPELPSDDGDRVDKINFYAAYDGDEDLRKRSTGGLVTDREVHRDVLYELSRLLVRK